MKLRVALLILVTFMLSGCELTAQKSGIEIITHPSSKVYIDGKEAGSTPYRNNSLKPGEVTIRLVVNETEWQKKVHLENGANTVINREFSTTSKTSGGYILYFESTGDNSKAGILISSLPDKATVAIDDEIKGFSPIRLDDIGEGDKKLVISYPGHKSISSFVKFVGGYQLVINADLPEEERVVAVIPPEATPTQSQKKVAIRSPETGWLRVRSTPDASGNEVSRVSTNEEYVLIEEKNDWLLISLGTGKSGWISSKYAEKLP